MPIFLISQETKFAGEIKSLEQFYSVLQSDPDRAVYGPIPVIKANEEQAVETLLITDELFRWVLVDLHSGHLSLVPDVLVSQPWCLWHSL